MPQRRARKTKRVKKELTGVVKAVEEIKEFVMVSSRMRRWLLLFACCLVVGACQPMLVMIDDIDRRLFPYSGRTLLTDASYVKISDAHLDNSILLGKTVIVQGMVHSRGDSDTFIVLQGDGARMVVDMTALPLHLIKKSNHERLKILGKLAITGLGFPYIAAESLALL